MTSELETNLVAVERIDEYCVAPTEVIFRKNGKAHVPHKCLLVWYFG